MPKKAPCELCEDWQQHKTEGTGNHELYVELYPANGHIAVLSYATKPDGELEELEMEIPMNYCPNCGKKLQYE
jgi:hypothetical protein